jgi:hypothetical protein
MIQKFTLLASWDKQNFMQAQNSVQCSRYCMYSKVYNLLRQLALLEKIYKYRYI